jgi:hypothetical protein
VLLAEVVRKNGMSRYCRDEVENIGETNREKRMKQVVKSAIILPLIIEICQIIVLTGLQGGKLCYYY